MSRRLTILTVLSAANLLAAVILLSSGGDDSPTASNGAFAASVANAASNANEQSDVAVPPDLFEKQIQPFMAKYCYSCHGPEKQKAALGLHEFDGKISMQKDRRLWEEAIKLVRTQAMPEGKGPMPSLEERLAFQQAAQTLLDDIDCDNPDPGRVTIRRLNKAEYNNTIRDLLGVDFKPADDFPDDDVGYGFDNIGDVLSLPPVLLEKYLAAAQGIAARATAEDPNRARAGATYEEKDLSGGSTRDGARALDGGNDDASVIHLFPADGEYELSFTAFELRGGNEHAVMAIDIDGKEIGEFEVKADKDNPQVYTLKSKFKRGRRRVAARFTNDFSDNNFEPAERRDRDLFVKRIEIRPLKEENRDGEPLIFLARPNGDSDNAWRDAGATIFKTLARRAYRRPVTDEEVGKLVNFIMMAKEDGLTFDRSVELAVTAMLVSPHFLFRVEQDPAQDDEDNIRELNDHELAVRLSYFLWSSMPDARLFELAENGELTKPDVLEREVERMLKDNKVRAFVRNFAGQWLHLRQLERHSPDPKRFPTYDKQLENAMVAETEMFIETIIREDRSVLEFLDARFTFLNKRLAEHYGIKGVDTDYFQRVSLEDGNRGGLLTQASVLTVTSNPTRTNPVLRGKYVLEEILGTPPPPPPADVPPLEEGDQAELTGTLRQRMEQHRSNEVCASCHARMDPIGFGLENFDAIGRWRDKENDHPIDASGELPDGSRFNGPAELKSILLKQKEQFARNLAEKMLTYSMGRGLEYYDKCTVDALMTAMRQADYRFSSLVMAIVRSDPFTKRRGLTPDELLSIPLE